jgi:hypothetical protein
LSNDILSMSLFFPSHAELGSAVRSANWRAVPLWLCLIFFISLCTTARSFFVWVHYEAAVTPQQALVQSPGLAPQINPAWKALTINHGQVSEWSLGTKDQNPNGYHAASLWTFGGISLSTILGFCVLAIASRGVRPRPL